MRSPKIRRRGEGVKEYKTLFICCGTGGSTLGFQEARQEYRGMVGQLRTLAGIEAKEEWQLSTKGIWVDSGTDQGVIVNVKH